MEREDAKLVRIGLFSQLTRISVRMLRHYQQQGLLVPTKVDSESGYRFYAIEQLETARLITGLRGAGFSISATREVLDALDDPQRVRDLFAIQQDRLRAHRRELDAEVAALARMSVELREHPMEFDVRTITMPAMTVASLRENIASYDREGELWKKIMPLIGQSGATFPAEGIFGATFHDEDYKESDVDVEVWVQVAQPFTPITPLKCVEVPEQTVVTATLHGDYSAMPQVTAAVGAYIAEHGLATGPMFNVYRVGPTQNPDPSTWVTDVCFPVVDNQG